MSREQGGVAAEAAGTARASFTLSAPAVSQERYTCPSLALHPREPVFLAQTNGNYLALFSAVWPYRMSRRRRYEGHKVPLTCHPPPQMAEHWPQSLLPHHASNRLGVRPLSSRFCFLLPR